MSEILLGDFVWIMLLMLGLWIVSVRLPDASIVDVFWGMGFVLIAWRTSFLEDQIMVEDFNLI